MFKKSIKQALSSWQLYVLLLPAVIYTFIFAYMPIYGVQISFKNYRTSLGIWGSEWIGLDHFRRFISFPNFRLILENTVRIGVYSLATFPCAIILALMINEVRNKKFKKTVQMITYAPYFLSTVVICSMLILFLNRDRGVVNQVLSLIGLERVDFLNVAGNFAHIYVWSGVWQGVGFGTIIYLAALSTVSPELVEAARIDGAGRLRVIWHVNLPAIAPTIVILLILSCGGILSVGFEKVFLLQTPLNLSRSQVIATYVYEIGLRGAQFSYASAIGLFNTAISLIIILIVNAVAKRVSEIGIW